jgi:uncharacterized membrane protein YjfL (UPF0719 family)
MQEIVLQFAAAAAKMIAAIILTAGSLYFGMRILDRMTSGIDEWKEIRKGNMAVGIFYLAALLSLVMLIAPRIAELQVFIDPALPLKWLALTAVNYLISIPLAILVIYLAVHVVGRLTVDVDELSELKKGNVAMSLVFSISVILVSFMAIAPMEYLFMVIRSLESLI